MTITKVDNDMIDYYKASLDYAFMFGNKDTTAKIKKATVFLNQYMREQVSKHFTDAEQGSNESDDYLWIDEEDLDEETLEYMTSSNTTYH